MRWMAICALLAIGCGSVGAAGDGAGDGANSGTPCPVENFAISGGDSNPNCLSSGDLYSSADTGVVPNTGSVSSALIAGTHATCDSTTNFTVCQSETIAASGYVAADGTCAYTVTQTSTKTPDGCQWQTTETRTAFYSTLQANEGKYPTH